MPIKALVTGGGGFLGSRIVQLLYERGDEVTALGRRRYAHHERAGIKTLQADLRDARAVRRSCQGVDIVFHVAALTGVWGRRRDFRAINIGGTQHVIDACRANGVRKLVYTSSPSVVFGDGDLCGVDESQPYPKRYLAPYPQCKAEAERMVLDANGADFATVALRPHLIWGPGDPNLIPRVIERAKAGKLKQVGDGENLVDITYIDNAAMAHLTAADRLDRGSPCSGKAYFISQGEPVRLWSWLNEVLSRIGAPTIKETVSFKTSFRVGWALEMFHGVFMPGREPMMTRFVATQLSRSHYFNISAAKRDFGYEPKVSTAEGVDRLIRWLKNEPRTVPKHPAESDWRAVTSSV